MRRLGFQKRFFSIVLRLNKINLFNYIFLGVIVKIISIFISCLFTLSCASYNAGQDRGSEFIKKPILQSSLISGEKLSEEAIKITLNSKVVLPQKIRLAVAYL